MFESIDKDTFDEEFKKQVYSRRDGVDTFEERKYKELITNNKLEYFKGTLEKVDLDGLILPHHNGQIEHGRDPNIVVKLGGEDFKKVVDDFLHNYIPNNRFPETVKKVSRLKEHFFSTDEPTFDANFIFISNNREIAHDLNHYDSSHGINKLFIGNGFHRFVAYGLAIEELGFKPINVYLVKADNRR